MNQAVRRAVIYSARNSILGHLEVDIIPIQSRAYHLGIDLRTRPNIELSYVRGKEDPILEAIVLTRAVHD